MCGAVEAADYRLNERQPDEESYSTIYFSLVILGDFGRYVVEWGMKHFSRYKYGEAFPVRETWEQKLVKSRWRKFERSLTSEQCAELERIAKEKSEDQPSGGDDLITAFHASLTEEQSELLRAAWQYPRAGR